MTTYAVVLAARMTSDRLPGKALAQLAPGITVLGQLIERWRTSDRCPTLIVTTTTDSADDPIAHAASALGVTVSRGDPRNVVAQVDAALRRYAPDARYVARALADNPLVDVALADWRLDVLAETGADGVWYGGDEARITYAGTTDVWSRAGWDRIVAESAGSQLEHPGQAYWETLSRYNVVQLPLPRREYLAAVRTELDTAADLDMLHYVWEVLGPVPSTLDALKWLARHPDVAALNAGVPVKTQSRAAWPRHHKPWTCDTCKQRMGSLVNGNLRVYCPGCGEPRSYYAHKPVRGSYQPE